ncbi:MAG: hypothetical protein M3R63_05935 [Actinomycetota bacterium]|nr:hypothetical protein [Actinomycetota bacterium]
MSRDCDAHSRVSEEFRRLAEAIAERAGAAPQRGRQQGSTTCTWCPLCAVVGLLRGERPELAEQLAAHGAGLLAVLREVVAAPRDADVPADRPAQRPRVQYVTVQRSGEGGGAEC